MLSDADLAYIRNCDGRASLPGRTKAARLFVGRGRAKEKRHWSFLLVYPVGSANRAIDCANGRNAGPVIFMAAERLIDQKAVLDHAVLFPLSLGREISVR
jgi:hypothetical protein